MDEILKMTYDLYETPDVGDTSLLNEKRIPKDDIRLHLLGNIDELNGWLGIVKCAVTEKDIRGFLEQIQLTLLKICAGIADPDNRNYRVKDEETQSLEKRCSALENGYSKSKEILLPGKSSVSAKIDVARSVARRCERYFVTVSRLYSTDLEARHYFNRLSDYLFCLARKLEYEQPEETAVLGFDGIEGAVIAKIAEQVQRRLEEKEE